MNTDTKRTGDITEAQILAVLVSRGEVVLIPFGDRHRYDLVLDRSGNFVRVQCKTGRIIKGVLTFNSSSYSPFSRGRKARDYRKDADFFGVYCPDTHEVFLIPVKDVGRIKGFLRVVPTSNGQTKKVKWASTYKLM